jgi:carboxylesterase type B
LLRNHIPRRLKTFRVNGSLTSPFFRALLLKWVQEYIHLVGGDANAVSAWGESAGAGSILHHLIRRDGTVDPLFHTFFAQSPAFEWSWDNSPGGALDQTVLIFSELAGCSGYDISCLSQAKIEELQVANQQLFNKIRQTGLFPVGPAVDGDWIKTIPAVALSQSTCSHSILVLSKLIACSRIRSGMEGHSIWNHIPLYQ